MDYYLLERLMAAPCATPDRALYAKPLPSATVFPVPGDEELYDALAEAYAEDEAYERWYAGRDDLGATEDLPF